MTKPKPRCDGCRRILKRIGWNTKVDLLICNNEDCIKFLQPQGRVYLDTGQVALG